MAHDPDEFEGIDISGPWGGIRIGSGGGRWGGARDWDEDAEVRRARRRVRQRLDFYRQVAYFIVIVGGLALLDGLTGGGWWVQWLAIIWGAFIVLQALTTFVAPSLWGRDTEERMVRRELERRRRGGSRVHVPAQPAEPQDDLPSDDPSDAR